MSKPVATVVATMDARAVGRSGMSSAHDPVVPKSIGKEIEKYMTRCGDEHEPVFPKKDPSDIF